MGTHALTTCNDTLFVSLQDAVAFLEGHGFHMELTIPVEVVGNVQEQDGSFFNYKCKPARKSHLLAVIDMAQGRDWAFGIQQYHEMDARVKPLADYLGVERYRPEKGLIPKDRVYWSPEYIAGWLDRRDKWNASKGTRGRTTPRASSSRKSVRKPKEKTPVA